MPRFRLDAGGRGAAANAGALQLLGLPGTLERIIAALSARFVVSMLSSDCRIAAARPQASFGG